MEFELENLVNLDSEKTIKMKVDNFLTRTDYGTMSRFNLGDPQTILHRTLPFLEIAARLTIRHGGILNGTCTSPSTSPFTSTSTITSPSPNSSPSPSTSPRTSPSPSTSQSKSTTDYTKNDWTALMAKVLETSSIYDQILTIEADSNETKVVLKSPEVARHFFAQNLRIDTNHR